MGLFRGVSLDVCDVGLGGVPDVLRGVVVGGIGWEADRFDPLQCLSGSYRSVTALAWWNPALSRTTAIFSFSVPRTGRAMARVIHSAFWSPSMGWTFIFLLVRLKAPKNDRSKNSTR